MDHDRLDDVAEAEYWARKIDLEPFVATKREDGMYGIIDRRTGELVTQKDSTVRVTFFLRETAKRAADKLNSE